MRDYTHQGTPVAQMQTEDIHDCLQNGFKLVSFDGDASYAMLCVRERLDLELFIRQHGLRDEVLRS